MAYPEWRDDLSRPEGDEFVEFSKNNQKSVIVHQSQVAQSQPVTRFSAFKKAAIKYKASTVCFRDLDLQDDYIRVISTTFKSLPHFFQAAEVVAQVGLKQKPKF
jgi:hypothetical protein